MTLRQKQSAFCLALGQLIVWAYGEGYEFTLADGNIDPIRRVRLPGGVVVNGCRDLVHKETGLHYKRLAADLNLFIAGKFIADGDHPAWQAIGEHWESLDPNNAWGGRFKSRDSNHLSHRYGGAA